MKEVDPVYCGLLVYNSVYWFSGSCVLDRRVKRLNEIIWLLEEKWNIVHSQLIHSSFWL
jgi:hypothetical protein